MATTHIDYPQVMQVVTSTQTPTGDEVEVDGYVVPLLLSATDVATLLAAYDDTDAGSPDATTAREMARAVLDALKLYTGS